MYICERITMEPRNLICTRCLKPFIFVPNHESDTSPRYHSKSCRTRAQEQRSKQFKKSLKSNGAVCPTPYKKWYRTWEEADRAVIEINSVQPGLRPYKCPCGVIHVGHGKKVKK